MHPKVFTNDDQGFALLSQSDGLLPKVLLNFEPKISCVRFVHTDTLALLSLVLHDLSLPG
jgi:hypothetical protein